MKTKLSAVMPYLLAIAPAIVALILWELFANSSPRRAFLFASPTRIASAAFSEFSQSAIYHHFTVTSIEVILGLIVGSILGAGLGFGLWIDRRVGRFAIAYVIGLGSIPIFAIAPLLIIWFGTGLLAKVVMAASSVFLISLVASYNQARRVSYEHAEWLSGVGASRRFALRFVIVPEAARATLEVSRLNVGFAILGAFIAEFVSSNAGLGFYILRASGLYDTARVLLGVGLLAVLALLLTGVIYLIEIMTPALRDSRRSYLV